MDIFKTNAEDSLYWLKVAMIQAQSDIKSNKKEIHELKLEIDRLKESADGQANGVQQQHFT